VSPASTSDAPRTLIFLHIPKTAGMSVRQVIERNYPKRERFRIQLPNPGGVVGDGRGEPGPDAAADGGPRSLGEVPAVRRWMALPEERRRGTRIIDGHTLFGVHEFVPGPVTYFTMFREPTSRTLSEYRYLQRRTDHWMHADVSKMSLAEYVRSAVGQRDNLQTRIISGRYFGVPHCTEETLELAKRNLERFAPVGLTERFDESLLMWGKAFGWKHLHYVPQNVTRTPAPGPVPDEVLRTIGELNRFDLELYRFATELFDAELRRHPTLPGDLARFRRTNGIYRRFVPVDPRMAARPLKRAVMPR